MQYKIYQVKIPEGLDFESKEAEERYTRLRTQSIYGYLEEYVHRLDYREVYSGTLTDEEILDKCDFQILNALFDRFNLNPPEDFTGLSMSASDVVELINADGHSEFFYCAGIGWDAMPNGF